LSGGQAVLSLTHGFRVAGGNPATWMDLLEGLLQQSALAKRRGLKMKI